MRQQHTSLSFDSREQVNTRGYLNGYTTSFCVDKVQQLARRANKVGSKGVISTYNPFCSTLKLKV